MRETESNELFHLLYVELKQHARRQLRRIHSGQSLRPTALVHEAYLRIISRGPAAWDNRSQFFAVAIRVMHDILVDRIRRNSAKKRGGGLLRVTWKECRDELSLSVEELVTLANALAKLERDYPAIAQLVLLRFLAGFTMGQIATMSGVSRKTIERRWKFARAWLQAELGAV